MVRKCIVDILSFCRYFSENGDSTVGASILIKDFNKCVGLYFRFPVDYFQRQLLSNVAPSVLANETGTILDFFLRKFRGVKTTRVTQMLKIFFSHA